MLTLLALATLASPAAAPVEGDASPAPTFDAEIAAAVADVAPIYPVPTALVRAVIREESACDPAAVSRVGAKGLMQLMPATAVAVGIDVKDLFDPAHNILAGTRLLAALLQHYRGDLIATLVAYNAGPRSRLAPIPKNGETPGYVLGVLRAYFRFSTSEGEALCSASKPRSSSRRGRTP